MRPIGLVMTVRRLMPELQSAETPAYSCLGSIKPESFKASHTAPPFLPVSGTFGLYSMTKGGACAKCTGNNLCATAATALGV